MFFIELQMSTANELWLEDMSLKLLCVFALDRFGDFVTDEVHCWLSVDCWISAPNNSLC
jgi:hypothetical protein